MGRPQDQPAGHSRFAGLRRRDGRHSQRGRPRRARGGCHQRRGSQPPAGLAQGSRGGHPQNVLREQAGQRVRVVRQGAQPASRQLRLGRGPAGAAHRRRPGVSRHRRLAHRPSLDLRQRKRRKRRNPREHGSPRARSARSSGGRHRGGR